ncbi:MAG: nucleotidyl transferase AbiEii/AbiGii toxin family protein [Coriobacteriales bacterium]|jgi:predicted nucleotidyltransferase component of viral defense system|nr:nucleotidyl transferase AbiEii/AbiGii toxin family protein [Coriobacteriales bacterium]
MNLQDALALYQSQGYDFLYAQAKACQDVVLAKIAASQLSRHVTIKGGIVMHELSHDLRRATRDIDFDFIRYSLLDESIRSFIAALDVLDDGMSITITGKISDLKHQDYKGKRVLVNISDGETTIQAKLDIGIHCDLSIEQEDYCFDLGYSGEGVDLLANSKEQIFAEKLKSLLKFGPSSYRYKDIYDLAYLSSLVEVDKTRAANYIKKVIFDNPEMWENDFGAIERRLKNTFTDREFIQALKRYDANWLDVSDEEAFSQILAFIRACSSGAC